MKVTILYDNTVLEEDLKPDWGFSALVEVEDAPRILFDTGDKGNVLLSNMKALDIDPNSIDEVFISHPHHDHIGGLPDFLAENNKVKLYVPASFSAPQVEGEVVSIQEPQQIHEEIYSTGEVGGIEQSLAVKTKEGIIIIAGCSHPPMKSIREAASQFGELYSIVGGLHGTKPKSLDGLKLICATHCTQHKEEIKSRFPEKYVEGGAGRVIEI